MTESNASAASGGAARPGAALGAADSIGNADRGELDKLVERSRVHTGLIIAGVLAVLLWAVLKFTTFGTTTRRSGPRRSRRLRGR